MMDTIELIEALGYQESPHFLVPDRFDEVPEHSHLFERASRRCSVRGVYLLRDESRPGLSSSPVLYVAQAESEDDADRIHRQVWNQNVVPFLLVQTPRGVRLYSGFDYGSEPSAKGEREGVLETAIAFEEVTVRLAAFRASAIDDGTLWRQHGETIDPERRVDRRLLDNLEALGQWLHDQGLERSIAHALIGKLVYLRYLRDRNILSDRRLATWEIYPGDVFGRSPSVAPIRRLVELLDDWLNGAVFPLPLTGPGAPSQEHVEHAAGVFLGDDVRSGQLHLDFRAYDFSQIPIETLSTVYEQFLAIEGRSRQEGAYYTPLPLVDFMLDELDSYHPLRKGMRVLDPACGSGAFLVQCYRRLIERQRRALGRRLRPSELRELLVEQIFGVDRDGDACEVAELSLILTMLDYIEPPDLQSTPNFKLPDLRGANIYESDFFDPESTWVRGAGNLTYDWIVGNPPWIQVSSSSTADRHVMKWIERNSSRFPVGGHQAAEAFAWKAACYSTPDRGVVGLLLPAMILFKKKPKKRPGFRQRFFESMQALSVVNFSNLREVLFSRRARLPAAALVYRRRETPQGGGHDRIVTYSPLVANQEANRPSGREKRKPIWNIVPNSSEISYLEESDLDDGSNLPWKLAMWGANRDKGLIKKISQRFHRLGSLKTMHGFHIHEGFQLQEEGSGKDTEPFSEIIGKKTLITRRLSRGMRLHTLPGNALERVPQKNGFLRKRGGKAPLSVCYPPHVVVGAARTFAVYSDEFIVIPPRQIGIAGSSEKAMLLKALALYLNSDFARYYEFFTAPQWGIRDGRSTLDTLKGLPVPWADPNESELNEWAELHRELVEASIETNTSRNGGPLFPQGDSRSRLETLNQELNRKVECQLGLSDEQRWLVHDLVHVRIHLTDGKLGEPAVRPPSREDLEGYACMLRDELDAFLDGELGLAHRVTVWKARTTGAVQVEVVPRTDHGNFPCRIHERNDAVIRDLERIQRAQSFTRQWIYFDRNCFIYDRDRTVILKPDQRLWWLRSQAMEDADEIIAAALASEGRDAAE